MIYCFQNDPQGLFLRAERCPHRAIAEKKGCVPKSFLQHGGTNVHAIPVYRNIEKKRG